MPPYFDLLIDAFRRGSVGRAVHLGHWDDPARAVAARPMPGEFERAQARLDEILLGAAAIEPGHAVLDAGCGFGGTIEQIDARHDRMRLVGVNVDPRQLAICRQLHTRRANTLAWVEADACVLPFADAAFDRVLCVEAIFHFRSRRAFFVEAARVLRPGGALVLSDILVTVDARDAAVEAALRDGYGPWPEVWSDDVTHADAARAAGLTPAWRFDATSQTRPSHRFTVPPGVDESSAPDPGLRAALTLKRLHEHGGLGYAYMRFDRPADAGAHA